ncbi:MAG: PH domain-containing protein [Verrucomicrobiota bacterium]
MNATPSPRVFPAVWSRGLRIISGLATLWVGFFCPVGMLMSAGRGGPWFFPWLALAGPAAVLAALAFRIRRYDVDGDHLRIVRPGWSTRVPLAGLESVEFSPGAFDRAWRICGNGGFFSYSGWFYQRPHGLFRAWVTDPARAVTLRLGRRRIVVSPEPPLEFVEVLAARLRNRSVVRVS